MPRKNLIAGVREALQGAYGVGLAYNSVESHR